MSALHRSAAVLLAVLATLAALAACTAAGPSTPSASPTTMTEAQVLALARELVQCLREHGIPDLPDPVMVDGRPELPDVSDLPSGSVEAAMTQCRPIGDRLRTATAGSGQEERPPLSAEDLAKARRYAECMREHGLAGFPDPDSTGLFHVEGTPVQELLQQKDPVPQRLNDAMQACRELAEYPGWGIRN